MEYCTVYTSHRVRMYTEDYVTGRRCLLDWPCTWVWRHGVPTQHSCLFSSLGPNRKCSQDGAGTSWWQNWVVSLLDLLFWMKPCNSHHCRVYRPMKPASSWFLRYTYRTPNDRTPNDWTPNYRTPNVTECLIFERLIFERLTWLNA